MKTPSPIRMVPQNKFREGVCGVCGIPAFLKFHDTSIGIMVGDCCIKSLVFADNTLRTAGFPAPNNEVSK